MTEPHTPADDAQAADPAPAPAAPEAAAAPTPPAATPEVTPEIQALIDEAARKASRDANREAIAAKKRAKELEEAEEARKHAELSEAEQAKAKAEAAEARATELETKLRESTIEAALRSAARAANYADEADALQLAPTIKLDDDGRPVEVTEAVAALLASRPHYAATPGTPRLDPSNGGRGTTPELTPQQQTQNLWANARGPSIWNIPAK
jgi:hypothetical protein